MPKSLCRVFCVMRLRGGREMIYLENDMNNYSNFPTELEVISEKFFYKYKGVSNDDQYNHLLDALENKYFYFSKPSQLNDPFDMHTNNSYEASDNEIKEWILKHKKINILSISDVRIQLKNGNLKIKMDEAAEKDKNNFNVLSLCDNPLNEILWGTYADTYSGLCLCYRAFQFDNEIIDNSLVYYIETKNQENSYVVPPFRKINEKNYFFLRPVKYDNDGSHLYKVFNKNENRKEIEFNIYHKKDIWKSENEYRAILLSHPQYPKVFNQKVYYGDNTLSEVIFGYNINEKKKKEIIKIINENYNNVSLSIIKPNYKEYRLEKQIYL